MGQSVAFSVQQARRAGGMVLPVAGRKGDYFEASEWQRRVVCRIKKRLCNQFINSAVKSGSWDFLAADI